MITMVAEKLKRSYLSGSSFSVLIILEYLLQLQFIIIEPLMVAGDSPTNVCGVDLKIMVVK